MRAALRWPFLLAGLVVLLLVVGAVLLWPSSQETARPPSPSASPTRSTDVGRLSMTGLPGNPATTAIVVKVNNTAVGGRQSGVGEADVVVEQLVEGGLSRLAVIYQSHHPPQVGPVRSGRSTDKGLVLPTHGWLVDTGASWFEARDLARAGLVTRRTGEYRVANRPAPYNVMLRPVFPAERGPLPPYFNFVARPSGPSTPVSTARMQFGSGGVTTEFTRLGRTWRRSPDLASPPFRPDSVLILRLAQHWMIDPTTGKPYHDAAGTPVPEQETVGSGAAVLLWHGRAYRGTWSHRSYAAPWHLSMGVPVGRTAVELVPVRGTVSLTR